MKKILNITRGLICCLFFSPVAMAQLEIIDKNASPMQVELAAIYASNINPTLSQDIPAYGVVIAPEGRIVTMQEQFWWVLDYAANIEKYELTDKSTLSAIDNSFHTFNGQALLRVFITDKWSVDTHFQHIQQTQHIGEGISRLQSNITNADKLTQNNAGINLAYGSDTSRRFLSFKASFRNDKYDENNQYSSSFDLTQQAIELNFALRQSSSSRLILKVSLKQDDYKDITRKDSQLIDALLGIEWSPSGKSKLEVLIGGYQRDFEDNSSSNGFSWNLSYMYKPREDITFSLSSARFSDVSISVLTTDTVTQDINGGLKYQYNQKWSLGANLSSSKTDFEGSSQLGESTGHLEIGMQLKDHSMLALQMGYKQVDNDDLAYEQNEVKLKWQVSF